MIHQKYCICFSIPLPPITKKNSQRIMTNRATGKPFVSPSQQFKDYEASALWYIPKNRYIDFPVNIECHFYMPTRRKVDLTNLLEAIDDIMVKAGLLKDDNSTIIQSHDGSRVFYNKENPHTFVCITKAERADNKTSPKATE